MRRDKKRCQTVVDLDTDDVCGKPATEVDHVVPGDDHRLENLEAICEWHHARKSSAEGNAARAKQRAIVRKRFQRTEDHPGLL